VNFWNTSTLIGYGALVDTPRCQPNVISQEEIETHASGGAAHGRGSPIFMGITDTCPMVLTIALSTFEFSFLELPFFIYIDIHERSGNYNHTQQNDEEEG
jgi:hypothetical protein